MNMNRNYQPTSAPYTANNLNPHDKDLAWVKEFGTNTTSDVGDIFTTTDTATAEMSIDARLGMLMCDQRGADPDTMSGSTFLIPPWESYAESPAFGPDQKFIFLFAHLLLQETNGVDPSDTNAHLVLAGEDFVGNVDSKFASAVTIEPNQDTVGEEAAAAWETWGSGMDSDPTGSDPRDKWGTDLYIRMLIGQDMTDLGKESDMGLFYSRDGLSWTNPEISSQIVADSPLRRVGLGVSSAAGTALLDWVRIYNYPLSGTNQESGTILPPFPVIGGRRF